MGGALLGMEAACHASHSTLHTRKPARVAGVGRELDWGRGSDACTQPVRSCRQLQLGAAAATEPTRRTSTQLLPAHPTRC